MLTVWLQAHSVPASKYLQGFLGQHKPSTCKRNFDAFSQQTFHGLVIALTRVK